MDVAVLHILVQKICTRCDTYEIAVVLLGAEVYQLSVRAEREFICSVRSGSLLYETPRIRIEIIQLIHTGPVADEYHFLLIPGNVLYFDRLWRQDSLPFAEESYFVV